MVRGESAAALLDEMTGTGGGAVGVQRTKRGVAKAPASRETAFASPMTEVAMMAQPVVDAALGVHLALHSGKDFLDADLARLRAALSTLANFLHQHAGERQPSEDAALQAAIDDALGVANALSTRNGPQRKVENEIRRHVADIVEVLQENTAREATLESPAALAGMVDESLSVFAEWKAFSEHAGALQAMPGLSGRFLDDGIATTTGWAEALKSDRGAADRLSRAIVDQHEVVAMASAELHQILKQPVSATTQDTIHAYFQVMSRSTRRREKTNQALEHARTMRRRLPLDRAQAALEDDFGKTLELEGLDQEAGGKARAEHRALAARTARMEKRIARGDVVGRGEIDDLVLETREYEFLHRVDTLRAQAKQALDAIKQVGGQRTVDSVDVTMALDEMISSLEGVRARYKDFGDPDPDNPRAQKREALRVMEIQLQHHLQENDLQALLKKAQAVIDDQIVSQFVSQLLWTIALTVSGNFVAAGVRGATEAAVLRIGGSELVAVRTATMAAYASEAAYGAVTQKYLQGDPASLSTLLAVNVLTPLAIDRVMKFAKTAERIGEGATDAAARAELLIDDAARLADVGEMAKPGADLERAVSRMTRLDRATKSSKWVKRGRSGALVLRGGVNLTSEMIVGAAVDYATRRAAAEGARAPDEQTATEWLMMGAGMAIGRHLSVNVKAIRTRLEAVQSMSRSATDHLLTSAKSLIVDADLLDTGKKPAAEATDVLQRYLALLAGEQAFLERELTATIDGQGHYGRKQLMTSLAANRRATGEMRKLASGELGDDGAGAHKTRAGDRADDGADVDGDAGESRKQPAPPDPDRDPHSPRGIQENAAVLAAGQPGYNEIVGHAGGENAGLGLLQRLSRGDASALKEIGFEGDPSFDPSTREWGLGKFDGKYIIIAGEPSAVDWRALAGVEMIGHSHPLDKGRTDHQGGRRLDVKQPRLERRRHLLRCVPRVRVACRHPDPGATPRAAPCPHASVRPRRRQRHHAGGSHAVGGHRGDARAPRRDLSRQRRPGQPDAPLLRQRDHACRQPHPVERHDRRRLSHGEEGVPRVRCAQDRSGSGYAWAGAVKTRSGGDEGEPAGGETLPEHAELIRSHGSEATEWATATIDPAQTKTLFDALSPAAIQALGDVSAAQALDLMTALSGPTLDKVAVAMGGKRLRTEVELLGKETAARMLGQAAGKGKFAKMIRHADNLEAARETIDHASMLDEQSIVVDSQIMISVRKLADGAAWSELSSFEQVMVNALRKRAGLPRLTTDPEARDVRSLIGDHDLRAANVAIGEVGPGLGLGAIETTVRRTDTVYIEMLNELGKPPQIGKGDGFADRAIVADALFARTASGMTRPS